MFWWLQRKNHIQFYEATTSFNFFFNLKLIKNRFFLLKKFRNLYLWLCSLVLRTWILIHYAIQIGLTIGYAVQAFEDSITIGLFPREVKRLSMIKYGISILFWFWYWCRLWLIRLQDNSPADNSPNIFQFFFFLKNTNIT